MRRLLLPTTLLVLVSAVYGVLAFEWMHSAATLRAPTRVAIWATGAWLVARVIALLLRGVFERRSGHQAPALLIDIASGAALLAVLSLMLVVEFGVPPTTAFATSGLLIAMIGFAVRSLVADLFYGLTMAIERPFEIGNWIRLNDGIIGRVEEMTWRAVKLVTKENLRIIVPNTLLAAEHLVNYDQPRPHWRNSFSIVLDYDVSPNDVERILMTAVAQVPESARVPHAPEARIVELEAHGVRWELRYWLPDYATSSEVSQRVQQALLEHLRFAGIDVPPEREHVFLGRVRAERTGAVHLLEWIEHVDLFSTLDKTERAELQRRSRAKRIAAGTDVVTQGEQGSSLFVVIDGALSVRIESTSGASEAVRTLGPGAVFGELSLLTGASRSATVTALTDTIVHEITKGDIEPLLHKNPELARQFAEIVTDRRFADERRVAARSKRDADAERAGMVEHLLARALSFFGIRDREDQRAAS